MNDTNWFVYMVRCCDHSLYTGITTNPQRRVAEHNSSGKGARYTRSRQPVSLVYLEHMPCRSDACKREYNIKKMSHDQKEQLLLSSSPK